MNEVVGKFLLAGDKVKPEIHLRHPGFLYSACGSYHKRKKEYKNLKKQEIHNIFIKTNYIKLAFNMTWLMEILRIYLPIRTASDKVLHDKVFNIAKNLKYDRYQRGLAPMVYKMFDKKSFSTNTSDDGIKNENMSNQELAEQLY